MQSHDPHRIEVLRVQGLTPADAAHLAEGRVAPAIEARIVAASQRRLRLAWLPLVSGVLCLAVAGLTHALDAPSPTTWAAAAFFPLGVVATVVARKVARANAGRLRGEITVHEGRARTGVERVRGREHVYLEIGGLRFENDGPLPGVLARVLVTGQPYRCYFAPGSFLLAVEPLPAAPTLLRRHDARVVAFDDEE